MVIIGLGSNIGDRRGYVSEAVRRLEALLGGLRQSRLWESRAVLPPGADKAWDMPFLNMAVSGETVLAPQALLAEIKRMERDMGRQARGLWGPREIDMDILAMDAQALETPELHIPHRELLNRDFALLPLVELAPDWIYPLKGPYQGWRACDIAQAQGFKTGASLSDAGRLAA